MDPSSLFATAIEHALSLAADHLKRAGDAKKANATACLHFLGAIKAAMTGLEEEVDEILVQATMAAQFRWDERAAVAERLNHYLHRDRLRPVLGQSLKGLEDCRARLEADPGFFNRQEKRELVAAVARLMDELLGYLGGLSGAMQPQCSVENYAGPSGINLPELLELQRLLADPGGAQAVLDLVTPLQLRRQREGLMLADKVARLAQELTAVFRLAGAGAS